MKSQRKKRILFVITQGTWGGAQRYVFDLSKGLSLDYEVWVAVGEVHGRRDLQKKILHFNQTQKQAIHVVELSHLKRSISPVHDVLAISELRALYKKIQPDIVHLNSSKASVLGTFAAYKYIPLVYTVHGWVFLEDRPRLEKVLYRWLEGWTAKRKQACIFLSRKDAEAAQSFLSKEQIHHIPLAIDPPAFLSKEEAKHALFEKSNRGLDPKKQWIGTIANHYRVKRLDILIQAAANLPDHFQIVIIGDGPERRVLEALIRELHLEHRIILLGALPNAARYLRALDVFVLSSEKEGLPYTLLEAAAAHVPIVATHVGGIPDYITDNKNGLLVEPSSVHALTEGISFAIHHPAGMSKTVHAAALHDLQSMISKTTSVYSLLLQRRESD